LDFEDGTKVHIEFFGSSGGISGGIELHPNEINKGFRIETAQLERWFQVYLNNMYDM